MSNKRSRDVEDEYVILVEQLSSSISRTTENKLQALDAIITSIDHGDELYNGQKALVEADCAFYLVELLQEPASIISLKAATCIKLMTQHSAPTIARLAAGPLVGLESTVAKVQLNPVQSHFVDNNAIDTLVSWMLGREEHKKREALETIVALTSYNHDGKLIYLGCLAEALSAGHLEAMEHIESLIDSMDCSNDEVSSYFAQIQPTLISTLATTTTTASTATIKTTALILLGTLVSKERELADEYIQQGVAKMVIKHLLHGSVLVKDAAARALYELGINSRQPTSIFKIPPSPSSTTTTSTYKDDIDDSGGDDRSCGYGIESKGQLVGVMEQLQGLVDLAEAEEAEHAEAEAAADDGDTDKDGYYYVRRDVDTDDVEQIEVCYSDEAGEVLQLLLKYNPDVDYIKRDSLKRKSSASCCIM